MQKILPFALTGVAALLTGCGGGGSAEAQRGGLIGPPHDQRGLDGCTIQRQPGRFARYGTAAASGRYAGLRH